MSKELNYTLDFGQALHEIIENGACVKSELMTDELALTSYESENMVTSTLVLKLSDSGHEIYQPYIPNYTDIFITKWAVVDSNSNQEEDSDFADCIGTDCEDCEEYDICFGEDDEIYDEEDDCVDCYYYNEEDGTCSYDDEEEDEEPEEDTNIIIKKSEISKKDADKIYNAINELYNDLTSFRRWWF